MSKEVNSKAIYLKSMKRWVPVSDEYYDIHRREIDAYIHRMRNHGCCKCPKSRWWLCDEDCWNCEFRCGEECISLETPCGENTEDISLGDSIADGCSDLQSIIEDRELLCKLFDALKKSIRKRVKFAECGQAECPKEILLISSGINLGIPYLSTENKA